MGLSQANIDIIKKSLVYYFETLIKFSGEEELSKITKIDLLNECMIIGKARNELENPSNQSEISPYSYWLNIPEYDRVICSALNCYARDLKKFTENISRFNAKVPLGFTDKQLQLVTEALKKIPNCERTDLNNLNISE